MQVNRAQPRRIGLVGAGWVTTYHLPAWRKLAARIELVGIADTDIGAAQDRAAAFAIADAYASAEAMFDAAALDVVDICAPREHHAGLVQLPPIVTSTFSARNRSPRPMLPPAYSWMG